MVIGMRSDPLLDQKCNNEEQDGQERNDNEADLRVANVGLCFF